MGEAWICTTQRTPSGAFGIVRCGVVVDIFRSPRGIMSAMSRAQFRFRFVRFSGRPSDYRCML